MTVREGEIFGFLGPNGAGKTTTLRLILGLLRPESGVVEYRGNPDFTRKRLWKSRVGFCPQELVVWDHLTCREQLVFLGRMYHLSGSQARERSRVLLRKLGLTRHGNRRAGILSGGLKRRLNIALALVHDPKILILDEPQAGLDPQSRVMVREYLQSLSGVKTIIMTTHEINEVDQLADRIGIIDQGKLIVTGSADELKEGIGRGDMLHIRMDETGSSLTRLERHMRARNIPARVYQGEIRILHRELVIILPRVLELIRSCGGRVRDITIRKKTLEDVFIRHTGRGLRD